MSEADLWAFVDEREAIRLRREAGQPWPWTDDPVLRDHHFTNVRRADDPGTRLIVDRLRAERAAHRSWRRLLVLTYCYRTINRPETFARHGLPDPSPAGLARWYDEIDRAKAAGEKIGSRWHQTFYERSKAGAYEILGSPALAHRVFMSADGQRAVRALVQADIGLGPFFGVQIVADLAEAQVGTVFGRHTMMPVSAGSRIGLQLVDGTLDESLLEERIYERSGVGRRTRELRVDGPEATRIRELVAARPDLDLTPVDVEHLLCEFGKYWLIRSGSPSGRRRASRLRRTW